MLGARSHVYNCASSNASLSSPLELRAGRPRYVPAYTHRVRRAERAWIPLLRDAWSSVSDFCRRAIFRHALVQATPSPTLLASTIWVFDLGSLGRQTPALPSSCLCFLGPGRSTSTHALMSRFLVIIFLFTEALILRTTLLALCPYLHRRYVSPCPVPF